MFGVSFQCFSCASTFARDVVNIEPTLEMRLSLNSLNVYTKVVNVYYMFTHNMAASNKTQMFSVTTTASNYV